MNRNKISDAIRPQTYIRLALVLTSTAILVSFALSAFFGLKACILCFYERILMIAMAATLVRGIWRRKSDLVYYALPVSLAGAAISFYHSLLQWGLIPEQLSSCVNGISCAEKQFSLIGFITLPSLTLLTFIAISILLITEKREEPLFV